MSIEKGYTTEISINDKITTVVYVFQIPTAIVGIHIMPGATGGGFGMYGQADGWYFSKKLVAPALRPTPTSCTTGLYKPCQPEGVSDTISTGTYFYDRWIRNSGTVTTNADYLTIGASAEIEQRIEGNMLAGETVTVTVKVGTSYISGSSVFPTSAGDGIHNADGVGGLPLLGMPRDICMSGYRPRRHQMWCESSWKWAQSAPLPMMYRWIFRKSCWSASILQKNRKSFQR